MKLHVACGKDKKPGFIGLDNTKLPGVSVVHDLSDYPWPFQARKAKQVYCSGYYERIPENERPQFMEELWRICTPGGRVVLVCRGVSANSFLYFDAARRKEMGFGDLKCDFDPDPCFIDARGHLTMVLRARKAKGKRE